MADTIDLARYLRHIGFDGPRAPTLETLRAVQLRHALAIPFENLDPLLRRPVPLDLGSLQAKMLSGRRGGYCFEQNRLFMAALTALGFAVTGLLARVLWMVPADRQVPRTHMLLRVAIDDADWIADVGFGGQTPTGPLRLVADIEQATPHEPFRLLGDGDGYLLQGKLGGEWRPLYRFDSQPQTPADYEMGNWYTSTHPQSRFLNNLIAARPAADRRFALLNREFAVHHLGGPSERRTLADTREVRRVLDDVFQVTPPEGGDLEAALARLP